MKSNPKLSIKYILLYIANILLYPFFYLTAIVTRRKVPEFQIYLMYLTNFEFAAMVNAQAKYETANYQSNAFLKFNNMFGMQYPKVRPTTASGTFAGEYNNGNGAVYKSTFDSIYDLHLWHKQHKDYQNFTTKLGNRDITLYLAWLKENGFFTADLRDYQQGVGAYYQGGGKWFVFIANLILIVFGSVLLWFAYHRIKKVIKRRKSKI